MGRSIVAEAPRHSNPMCPQGNRLTTYSLAPRLGGEGRGEGAHRKVLRSDLRGDISANPAHEVGALPTHRHRNEPGPSRAPGTPPRAPPTGPKPPASKPR